MQQKAKVADLGRRLEALKTDLEVAKRQFVAVHGCLARGVKSLAKALEKADEKRSS